MVLPDLSEENQLWQAGLKHVVGIDEVGRGSWAGPLVAAGVILPQRFKIPKGLADSKQVPKKLREDLADLIKKKAVSYYIAEISVQKINKYGLTPATNEAFRKIAKNIKPAADFCLIDAFYIKYFNRKKQKPLKHGDEKCASIAAASIVAKVYRDNLMISLSQRIPGYYFEKHKGYGTRLHQQAIKKLGLSEAHRTGYNLNFLQHV